MGNAMHRRDFLRIGAAGAAALGGIRPASAAEARPPKLVSPGCRSSKVKIARIFAGLPRAHYPKPSLDLDAEVRKYREEFAKLGDAFADVDFVVDEVVGAPARIGELRAKIEGADGVLIIHVTLGTMPVLREAIGIGRPTMIYSIPYSGPEWFELSALRRDPACKRMECVLTTDPGDLAAAIRPFRAMHHLREAKVLNVADWPPGAYGEAVRTKFGTRIEKVARERMLAAYEAVSEADARAEADRWTRGAMAVVEPSADEVLRSCRLALGMERLMDEEAATVMGVDCYGSMWRKLPAYPCIGFTRLNDMGLGGICQSDLPCAMVHVLFQGISGRPGFACNPTFDFSRNRATLIHCLGTTKMDGPSGPAAPYKLRDIMEREEGAVPQVFLRKGQRVTTCILDGTRAVRFFTGEIVDVPDTDRGCRTQIAVKLDGSAERLWRGWTAGIHRVTCYGDLRRDLERFCRFADLDFIDDAV